jgi:hypothetical protein
LGLHEKLSTSSVTTFPDDFFSKFFPLLSNDAPLPTSTTRLLTTTGICPSDTALLAKEVVTCGSSVADKGTGSASSKNIRTEDTHFREMFVTNRPTFTDLDEINRVVEQYEEKSTFHIVITRSGRNACIYKCKSHESCCFEARFGPDGDRSVLSSRELSLR